MVKSNCPNYLGFVLKKIKSPQLPWPCCIQETPLPQWSLHRPGPLASRWQSLSTTWQSSWSPFSKTIVRVENGDWDRYLTHACDWHALHHQLLQALWGPRQSPRQRVRCSRFSLRAQLLNLVSRGKRDGPQVFLLSKDGSHLSNDFFVGWKIHIHSFKW